MKRIYFLYRKEGLNFSIEHVFGGISAFVSEIYEIENVCLPYAKISFLNFLRNMIFARKRCGDIVHLTGDVHYAAIFCKGRVLLTIHDMRFLEFESGLRKAIFWLFWFYFPMRKSKCITCISNETKNKLLHYFPQFEKKIYVVYNPVDSLYKYSHKLFNSTLPRILHIGTADNKNLSRVIDALSDVKCELRIVGKYKRDIENKLEKSKIQYSFVSNLSDQEMYEEYKKCDIVSFPSTYEGFGMPIIEGQAVGRVVLTSNLDPMQEIASGAALLVNPYSIEDIRRGFLLLIENQKLRENLIEKGVENAKRFDVSVITNQYLKLYRTFLMD